MKRPSFQFYPGDWQANSNLRRCSHEEKGIWVDVLCLLHDQAEYGVVRWPLKEIAQAIGCTIPKLKGIVSKGVLKGADAGSMCEPLIYIPRSGRKNGFPITVLAKQDGPVWYSSRMLVDEYKSMVRGNNASNPTPIPPFGEGKDAENNAPKVTPNPTPNPTPSHVCASRAPPSSSSSSSTSIKPVVIHTLETPGEQVRVKPPPDDLNFSTTAGECCKAMVENRIAGCNPSHPTLLALIAAGATPAEFANAAKLSDAKGKNNFAYVIGTVKRQREEAAKLVLHNGKMPNNQYGDVQQARLDTVRQIMGEKNGTNRPTIDITPGRAGESDRARLPAVDDGVRQPDGYQVARA